MSNEEGYTRICTVCRVNQVDDDESDVCSDCSSMDNPDHLYPRELSFEDSGVRNDGYSPDPWVEVNDEEDDYTV